MRFTALASKRLLSFGAVVACAVGLGGCFDLDQKVAIGRDGSGGYAIALTTDGVMADAMRKKPADLEVGDMHMVTHVATVGDKTVQTSGTSFHDLSDLKLSDETISLHVKGQKLLGLMGTQVNFHRSFAVDHARRDRDQGDEKMGRDILTSMFGDHTYSFSVWLPGEIDKANTIHAGSRTIEPTIRPAGDGHTVTWKMKLVDLFLADTLDFDVDFTSRGNFHDATSGHATHRHHHKDET
jgi:hypothetical protein